MAPIGWGFAGPVWGYALFWFLVEVRIKLAAYRLFDWRQPGFLAMHLPEVADQVADGQRALSTRYAAQIWCL